MKTWTVYMHHNSSNTLLYVGCTGNLRERNYHHKATAPWWTQVTKTKTIRFKTKQEALAAESALIQTLKPLHNTIDGRSKDPIRRKDQMNAWRKRNPNYNNDWLQKHPGYTKTKSAEWRKKNQDDANAYQRAWYAKNKHAQRNYRRAWRAKNPNYMRTWRAKRAQQKALQSSGPKADPSTCA